MSTLTTDLLTASQVIVFDITDYALKLRRRYKDAFVKPEKGIYIRGMNQPVLNSQKPYYSEESYKTHTPIKALDGITSAILDDNGNVLIPRFVMRNKEKFISTEPLQPVVELQVIQCIIDDIFTQFVCYKRSKLYLKDLHNLVKNDFHYLIENGNLEAALQSLIQKVLQFIGNDIWNIYFVKLQQNSLIIEKSSDYRVYEWTRLMEEGAIDFIENSPVYQDYLWNRQVETPVD